MQASRLRSQRDDECQTKTISAKEKVKLISFALKSRANFCVAGLEVKLQGYLNNTTTALGGDFAEAISSVVREPEASARITDALDGSADAVANRLAVKGCYFPHAFSVQLEIDVTGVRVIEVDVSRERLIEDVEKSRAELKPLRPVRIEVEVLLLT